MLSFYHEVCKVQRYRSRPKRDNSLMEDFKSNLDEVSSKKDTDKNYNQNKKVEHPTWSSNWMITIYLINKMCWK